jgi:hypothetical protein
MTERSCPAGTNAMTCEQSIVIAGSADELFALTQDYARRLERDPFLKSAEVVAR